MFDGNKANTKAEDNKNSRRIFQRPEKDILANFRSTQKMRFESIKFAYNALLMTNNKIHEGRNVKRFREMLQIKQEALAYDLGEDWNQKKISMLEAKETIDPALLQEISAVLKIPVEAFQNFDEEAAIAYINTFHDTSANHGTIGNNYDCTLNFNPLDKMVELYERMLQQQREMIEKLERLMEKG